MLKLLRHLFFPHESNNLRAKLLHPSSLFLIIGIFVVFQLAISQFTSRYPHILGYASQISPEEIVRLTNENRVSQGLTALQLDPQLSAAAAAKAADMVARDYWAHASPMGTQPWFFITQAGYSYRYAGENLARDFSNAPDIIQAWMDSPTHRENLLNSNYHDIGIAVIDGKLGDRETTLVVQMFGTKPSAVASIGSSASKIIAVKPVQAASIQTAVTSPFDVTKSLSLALLIIFTLVLAIDVYSVYSRKIVRWTSKSYAHLAFLLGLFSAALIISRGQII